MRRKRKIKKYIQPDPVYNNMTVSKMINHIMKEGKKTVAQKVVFKALDEIKKQTKKEPLEIFDSALKNVGPLLEVKSRRIGGATYQVPREVRGDRRLTLAMRWIIKAARAKKGKPMALKLADELMLASKNEGTAIKKRNDTHRMAEANKAFAHFSW